jgi:hypothetical protein
MRRQRSDPSYVYVPKLPVNEGDRATDETVLREAAEQV